MARHVVCKENGEPINGIVIAKGALKLPESRVPVLWNFNDDRSIGNATNFQRDDEGNITAEIELTSEVAMAIEKDYKYSIAATDIVSEPVTPNDPESLSFVIEGTLRTVALTPTHPAIKGNK